MENLRKKIEFTEEQLKALSALIFAYKACYKLGLDFVYDESIMKVVAVNLANAKLEFGCDVDENGEFIPFEPEDDDFDKHLYEIGEQMMYYELDSMDGLFFVNK